MDERSGHQELCGSGRWSVIPYVHRRTKLYCIGLPCLSLFFFPDPCEVVPARAFYITRLGSYNESRGLTGGLGVGQTLCCRAERLGVANDVFNDVGMTGLVACHPALGQWYARGTIASLGL
jgi:hypothetical protein